MAVSHLVGLAMGHLGEFPLVSGGSSIVAGGGRGGRNKLRCLHASGGAIAQIIPRTAGGGTVAFARSLRFYFRCDTAPSGQQTIAGFLSGSPIVGIQLTTGAALTLANGTVSGSSGALNDGQWHRVDVDSQGTQIVMSVDGAIVSTGTGAGGTFSTLGTSASFGTNNTLTSGDYSFCDIVFYDSALPATLTDYEVDTLLPTSDSARGGWTDGAGGTTSLFDSLNNAPPTGSATATNGTKIKNAVSSTTDNYDGLCPAYSTISGLTDAANVAALQGVCNDSQEITTGSPKAGAIAITQSAGGAFNTERGFDFGLPNGAAGSTTAAATGTFPTGWGTHHSAVIDSPAGLALSDTPKVRIGKRAATTRVVDADFAAVYVYRLTPPAGTPASGTASLSLSGSADWTEPASASLSLSGAATAQAPTASTASLSLSGSGTATSTPVPASGTASLTLLGSAVASASVGSAASLTLVGSATWSEPASAALTLSGSATARAPAAASAVIVLAGSAVWSEPASASLTLSGTATARAAAAAAAAISLSGSATWTVIATANINLSGSTVAAAVAAASAVLSLSGTSTAAAVAAASAALVLSGSAIWSEPALAVLSLDASAVAVARLIANASIALSGSADWTELGNALLTLLGSAVVSASPGGSAVLSLTSQASWFEPAAATIELTAVGTGAATASGASFIELTASSGIGEPAAGSGTIDLQGSSQADAVSAGAGELTLTATSIVGAAAAGSAAITLTASGTGAIGVYRDIQIVTGDVVFSTVVGPVATLSSLTTGSSPATLVIGQNVDELVLGTPFV